nr:MAG TPA: hypothetical protein [Caudoviricetes sp.]
MVWVLVAGSDGRQELLVRISHQGSCLDHPYNIFRKVSEIYGVSFRCRLSVDVANEK